MPVYNGEFRTEAGQPGPSGLARFGPILPVELAIPSSLSRVLAEAGPKYSFTSVGVHTY